MIYYQFKTNKILFHDYMFALRVTQGNMKEKVKEVTAKRSISNSGLNYAAHLNNCNNAANKANMMQHI